MAELWCRLRFRLLGILLSWIYFLALVTAQENVTVGFVETSVTVTEVSSNLSLVVALSRDLVGDESIILNITITNGTASRMSSDFMFSDPSGMVSFAASGDNIMMITILILDDDIFEDTEDFNVSLTLAVSSIVNGSAILENDTIQVFIADNDTTTVNFLQTSYLVMEGDSVMICANLSSVGSIQREIELTITPTGGSADASDFTGVSNIIFQIGELMKCFSLRAISDNSLEEEQQTLELTMSAPNQLRVMVGTSNVTIVTITDQDQVNVTLSAAQSVSEDDGSVMVCVDTTQSFEREVVVSLSTSDGSAIAGVDFTALDSLLTFGPGLLTQQCVDVNLTNDDCLEFNESFSVHARSIDPALNITYIIVTIVDSDTVTLGFTSTDAVSIQEGELVRTCVNISSGCVGTDVNLILQVTPLQQSDLTVAPSMLTFMVAGEMLLCVNITASPDNELEEIESFSLVLTNASTNRLILTPDTLNVSVLDNTVVTVRLDMTVYTVEEGRSVEVCVEVETGVLQRATTVQLSTMASTATDLDYTAVTRNLTFAAGDRHQCVNISTMDNQVVEGDRMFAVQLVSLEPQRVNISISQAQVTITDNDTVVIGMQRTEVNVTENNNVTVCAALMDGTLGRDVLVGVATMTVSSADAATGDDFMPLETTLLFNADFSMACVEVAASLDESREMSEVFSVLLLNSSAPPGQVVLQPNSTSITIFDVPSISMQPVDQFVVLGDVASFQVIADGFNLTYQWQRAGVALSDSADDISGSTTALLTLFNVSMEDFGEYSCVLSNLVTSISTDVVLLRQLEAPMFVQSPRNLGVLKGNDVTLNCSATSLDGTVNIIWMANDSQGMVITVPTPVVTMVEDNVTGSSITLLNVTDSQAGNYTCMAFNRVDSIISEFSFSVITVEGVQDVLTVAGVNVTLVCSASGDPRLTYQWSLTNSVIPFNDFTLPRVMGSNTSNLTITNVSLGDTSNNTASFTCVVSLFDVVIGSTLGYLTIQRVIITQPPLDATFTVPNGTLTLNCTAVNPAGAPLPLQFYWAKDSTKLDANRAVETSISVDNSTTTSVLTITNVMRVDSGRYFCTVTNRGAEDRIDSLSAEVTILFAPVSINISLDDGNDSLVVAADDVFPVAAGRTNYDVICVFEAMPDPFLYELRRVNESESILVNNATSSQSFSLRSRLPMLTVAESGVMFECAATNDLGRGSATFSIRVQDVPGSINHSMLTTSVVSLLSVRLTWPLPRSNNAPITSYSLEFCETGRGSLTCTINSPPLDVATDMTIINNEMVSYLWLSGVVFNSGFSLTVQAVNALGMGAALDNPAHVLTATPDDAMPDGISTSVLTDIFAIIVWNLPAVALSEEIVFLQFNFTFDAIGSNQTAAVEVIPSQNNLSAPFGNRLGGGFIYGREYNVSIVAIYTQPSAVSVPAYFTFTVPHRNNVDPIINVPLSVTGPLGPTFVLVSWPLPSNIIFLLRYELVVTTIFSNSRRRRRSRRQTGPVAFAISDLTQSSMQLNVNPFSDVTVDIFAIYMPDDSRAPLAPSINFMTLQDRPSAPTLTMLTPVGLTMLRLEWMAPSMPHGIIIEYRITYGEADSAIASRITVVSVGTGTSYIITNLLANTLYTASVTASTIIGPGDSSQEVMEKTDFGVSPPLSVNVVVGIIKGRYFISAVLSKSLGPIKGFQIIVATKNLPVTLNIVDIGPYTPSSSFYVVRAMDHAAGPIALEIGTGIDYSNYLDKVFESNTDYYFFVRAFSSIVVVGEDTRFGDSDVVGPFSFKPDLNTALVIGPIAAIAFLLIIILVVLLLVAYFTMAPCKYKNGYILPGGGGGAVEKRSKKGAGSTSMELRRTRLFSPVLNVGTADVFTSTNQPTTLICEASGTPAPVVMWSRNGEPLDKERFIQLADGSLFVNDTDIQDEGTYIVKATNSAGTSEADVRVTVVRPVPPEPDIEHPIIKVGEFSEKIALVRANDDEGLEDEYTEVELDWTFTNYAAKMNINKNKNRYINIIPYDHSRVALSLQDNTPGSDYINASFIDAFQRPNGYVASQGPIPSTFPDFWRMVWELDSPTIVMVTNLKEEDKIKCHQYWPSYGTTTYGNIQVTLKEVENLAEYSIRTFSVSPLAGQSRLQMPVREVRQFHFLVWPDHGVPLYATNLLSFRKRIVKYHSEKRGPMVVHCSAGVGRTGTFITIDYMLKQIDIEGTIDIFNFVRHMRFRRNYMVQTSPQYVFIHDAILESIMCGDNSIKAPELREKVKEMCKIVPETGMSVFESQFNTLKAASPPDADFDCSIAQLPDNMAKNRTNMSKNKFSMNLPANDYRVVLSSDKDQSDYICASYLDNYRERNAFIVTQAPLAHTVGDMWRMIWETKSAAIVMLTELIEDDEEMCVKYWPSAIAEPSVCGQYQVELSEEEKDRGGYITRRFKLSPVDNPQESRMVSQFHFVRWTKVEPPKDCRPMIDLIDELQRVQRKSGNMPITVHCDDGVGRTGAFCALYSVLERVKTEQIVDVFQAVKTLRIQRTGLLSTIMEYEFVHQAVIEFLDTFSGYQNFK